MKHNLSGLTPEQMAAVLALGDEQQTAAEPEVSPLLKVLRDIAGNLGLIADALADINARDSVWRRS